MDVGVVESRRPDGRNSGQAGELGGVDEEGGADEEGEAEEEGEAVRIKHRR